MVIADCVATGVLTIVGDLSTYNGAYVLVVIFLYTLDLYADFTGGIDITIGIAQSLGIKVAENFEHPYFSKSLKEYWRDGILPCANGSGYMCFIQYRQQ